MAWDDAHELDETEVGYFLFATLSETNARAAFQRMRDSGQIQAVNVPGEPDAEQEGPCSAYKMRLSDNVKGPSTGRRLAYTGTKKLGKVSSPRSKKTAGKKGIGSVQGTTSDLERSNAWVGEQSKDFSIADVVKQNGDLLNSIGVMLAISAAATVLPLRLFGAAISVITLVIATMMLAAFHKRVRVVNMRGLSVEWWFRFLLDLLLVVFIGYIVLAYYALIRWLWLLIIESFVAAGYNRLYRKVIQPSIEKLEKGGHPILKELATVGSVLLISVTMGGALTGYITFRNDIDRLVISAKNAVENLDTDLHTEDHPGGDSVPSRISHLK